MADQADRLRELIRRMKEQERQQESPSPAAATASRLRELGPQDGPMVGNRHGPPDAVSQARVIAVASGKGGVGKTNFVLNFSLALRQMGYRVLIWDADFGFSNLHVLMGKSPDVTLLSLLEQELDIWQAITPGVEGVEYISSGQGLRELFSLTPDKLNRFLAQFMQLRSYADYLIIDLGAGLSSHSMKVILAADVMFLLTTPEPTSMTDAYALLKLLALEEHDLRVHLVINRAKNEREGLAVYERMASVAERFLSVRLERLGVLPDDDHVVQAVLRQKPYLLAYPKSAVSRKTMELVERFVAGQLSTPVPSGPSTKSRFWRRFRQLVQSVSPISHGKR